MAKSVRPTILILISRSGGGHLNLAQAIQDQLSARYNVLIVDPQSPLVERGYTLASRRFVKLLTWQYILTDNRMAAWLLQNVLVLVGHRHFSRVIQKIRPQLIITTHALVSSVAALANKRSGRRVPLIFQFTDLERLHMTWFVEKHADAYLAPTREIFVQALEQGIDKDRLYLTGRPVRQQFWSNLPGQREETLNALGLNPALFTLFLQGGARGSAGVDRLVDGILAREMPIQIILAAGDNPEMLVRYGGIRQIHVLTFTEKIAPFMAASDVIAGKAGASFITEAFMLEKPFLVTTLIPGQETPSLQFIERHNLGWICLKTTAQQELLARLTSNPGMIAEKVGSIRAYRAWNIQAHQTLEPLIDRLLS